MSFKNVRISQKITKDDCEERIAGKVCTSCGVSLSLSNTSKTQRDRRNWKCIDCYRRIDREKRRENYVPEKVKFQNAKRIEKIKDKYPIYWSAQRMVYGAKQRAKKRGMEFNLTTEYVHDLCQKNCPILGFELVYGGGDRGKASASIDRIDSYKGYVKGNIQIISNLANVMKNKATDDELIMFAKWVLKNRGTENVDCSNTCDI